jgi:hypothetical protein
MACISFWGWAGHPATYGTESSRVEAVWPEPVSSPYRKCEPMMNFAPGPLEAVAASPSSPCASPGEIAGGPPGKGIGPPGRRPGLDRPAGVVQQGSRVLHQGDPAWAPRSIRRGVTSRSDRSPNLHRQRARGGRTDPMADGLVGERRRLELNWRRSAVPRKRK